MESRRSHLLAYPLAESQAAPETSSDRQIRMDRAVPYQLGEHSSKTCNRARRHHYEPGRRVSENRGEDIHPRGRRSSYNNRGGHYQAREHHRRSGRYDEPRPSDTYFLVRRVRRALINTHGARTVAREAAVNVILFDDNPKVITDEKEKYLRLQVSYLEGVIKAMKKHIIEPCDKKKNRERMWSPPTKKRKRDAEEIDIREKKKQQVSMPEPSSHRELAVESITKKDEEEFDEFMKDFVDFCL